MRFCAFIHYTITFNNKRAETNINTTSYLACTLCCTALHCDSNKHVEITRTHTNFGQPIAHTSDLESTTLVISEIVSGTAVGILQLLLLLLLLIVVPLAATTATATTTLLVAATIVIGAATAAAIVVEITIILNSKQIRII